MIFAMLFNGGMIPTFMVVKAYGLLNTVWALVLPGAVPIFNVILVMNFFAAVPKELEEAAMMENAGFLYRMRTIIFPLSKNGFMSSFLLIFMAIMKELDLLIILISPATQTLPYLTYYYESGGMEQFANVSAIIMFLIVFIVYWVANKFFDADLAKGM